MAKLIVGVHEIERREILLVNHPELSGVSRASAVEIWVIEDAAVNNGNPDACAIETKSPPIGGIDGVGVIVERGDRELTVPIPFKGRSGEM